MPMSIAAAAFAGAEGDAGDGGEVVAQGEDILVLQRLIADHGDGLRRVEQRLRRLGRFEHRLVEPLTRDDYVPAPLDVRLGVFRQGGRRSNKDRKSTRLNSSH